AGDKLDLAMRHVDECDACRLLVRTVASPTGAQQSISIDPELRAPVLSGKLLAGKYQLGQRLGSGGMGGAYGGINTWTSRKVAIKLLHPFLSSEREVAERFLQEAKSATRIAHPHVVEVLDMGQDPESGSLYMVQEFLVGETLRERLRRQPPLTPAEA